MAVTIDGNGLVSVGATSSTVGEIKLYEDTDNGAQHVGFQAPANVTTSVSWVLPPADGTSGQALITDGGGVLSFGNTGISTGKSIAMAMIFGF